MFGQWEGGCWKGVSGLAEKEKGNVDQRWDKDNAGRHKYTPGLKYKYKTNTNTASTVCKNEIGETRSEVGGGECRRRPNPP